MPGWRLAMIGCVLALCACTSTGDDPAPPASTPGQAATIAGSASAPAPASPSGPPPTGTPSPSTGSPFAQPRASATPTRAPEPPAFDRASAYAIVERLADDIGPREATSAAFREAADLVAQRFDELGYDVRRERVPVPAGVSWGVPVRSGTTQNVVATLPGFDEQDTHRLIGAHLDTVPQAPGAEDNASGVGVLLELARMAAESPPAVPVVFVAFGGEEPRGRGDAMHHFGSQRMVASMDDDELEAIAGMLSLDRVGVGPSEVPVCFGGLGSDDAREELVAAARRADISVRRCQNRTSDHWSFEKADVPAARLGGITYAGYHSAADRPSVVSRRQLERVGRVAAGWMISPE